MNDRTIRIVDNFSGSKADAVCFNTASGEDAPKSYDNRSLDNRALRLFFEELLLGSDFPSDMILSQVSVDSVVAGCLFSHPNLTLSDRTSSLVNSVEMVLKWGDVGKAHISRTHLELIETLEKLSTKEDTCQADKHKTLHRGIALTKRYLEYGQLPPDEAGSDTELSVLTAGCGFVCYEASEPAFDKIFREGYVSGLWVNPTLNQAMLYKKSQLVERPDLTSVVRRLNELDRSNTSIWDLGDASIQAQNAQWDPQSLQSTIDIVKEYL